MKKNILMPAVSLAAMAAACPDALIGAPRMDAAGATAEMLMDIKAEVGRVGDEVKSVAEDALKQAQKSGTVSEEVKATADKLLSQYHDLGKNVSNLEGKLEALETKNLDLSQLVAAGVTGNGSGEARQSLGKAVVDSDDLKAYLANGVSGSKLIKVGNAITTATPGGGGIIFHEEEREPVRMARRRLLIRNLLSQGRTGTDLVKYAKQTVRTNAAAPVAEEGTAPESTYSWDKAQAPVQKISHITHISEESLADSDILQTEIDGEMRYGLDLEEEAQILAGDGTGENLSGLITEATAFVAAAGLPDATHIDRLRLGILQVTLADYIADGITLNPTEWAAIELIKDTTNRYIHGDPNTRGTPGLWGLDVVPTGSHSTGEWMVGAFQMAATIYDRLEAEILISSEHGTNFVEGMLTMKGSKRVALAVKRATALVTGNFTFP